MYMSGAFIAFFDLVYIIEMSLIYPICEREYEVYIPLAIGIVTMYSWFIVQFSDPGYVKKPK